MLPFAGIGGYVAIIFFCELMNTFLSIIKLVKIIKVKFNLITSFLLPMVCSLGAVCTVRAIIYFTPLVQGYSVLNCVIKLGISLVLFCVLLFATGSVRSEEITSLLGKKRRMT